MNITKTQGGGNVKVFCRFRPFNQQELFCGNSQPVQKIISEKHLVIKDPYKGDQLTFVYDKIFTQQASQEQIYQQVGAPILQNILDGFNGTIIAYGQTSSGKTHTIQGLNNDLKNKGIIPRIIQRLFLAIQNSPSCIEFKLKVSILQLYMEKLYDLIDSRKVDLKIRQSKTQGPYVQGKTEVYISDRYQLVRLLNVAQKNRVTCSTSMNNNSSRSHLIFHLTLSQFNSETQQAKVSNLFIVDLAGSQKVSKTGAQGKLLQQAKKINLSLTSLAKVIKSLSQRIHHIPYRDSKLTRIIQDSLGGNSKTTLILTCSPSDINLCQTISTLRFGQTAQKIKNKPKINREPTIKQLKNIIIRLQAKIKIKDHWIAVLQAHMKHKLGINIPKKQLLKKYTSQRFFSAINNMNNMNNVNNINNKNNISNENNNSTPVLSYNVDQQYNPQLNLQQHIKINFDKYLNETLKLPQLDLNARLHSYLSQPLNQRFSSSQLIDNLGQWQSHSDSAQNERIMNLENQLAICKSNLNQQITKHTALKKQHNIMSDSMKSLLEQNISYQVKINQLEQLLKSLGVNYNLIINVNQVKYSEVQSLSDQQCLLQQQQDNKQNQKLKKINNESKNNVKMTSTTPNLCINNINSIQITPTNNGNTNLASSLNHINNSQINGQQIRQSESLKKSLCDSVVSGQTFRKIKQQNQILLKLCQQLKSDKQSLQVKVKNKQKRVEQLKSMMQQIQQQMQLMSEEYDQPINISFNTKIANPIKRNNPLICQ